MGLTEKLLRIETHLLKIKPVHFQLCRNKWKFQGLPKALTALFKSLARRRASKLLATSVVEYKLNASLSTSCQNCWLIWTGLSFFFYYGLSHTEIIFQGPVQLPKNYKALHSQIFVQLEAHLGKYMPFKFEAATVFPCCPKGSTADTPLCSISQQEIW